MAAFIKFDGADGNGFLKLGDVQFLPTPPRSPVSPRGVQWSATAKASLKEAGMTDQGIAALIGGRPCTNRNDQAIVTAIIAAIL